MKVTCASWKMDEDITNPAVKNAMIRKIERIGRTCYKSEGQITANSAEKFVRNLIQRGHEALLEHVTLTVCFCVDRGVSHEIVRHRIASYAQESTRYCRYSDEKFGKEITVIRPFFLQPDTAQYDAWRMSCQTAEDMYMLMLAYGSTPEEARCVLPTSLKTELWMTASLREWRHFLRLRAAGTTGKPHPQMAEVAVPLLKHLKKYMPEVFDDIETD